jgi:hypothetical protein
MTGDHGSKQHRHDHDPGLNRKLLLARWRVPSPSAKGAVAQGRGTDVLGGAALAGFPVGIPEAVFTNRIKAPDRWGFNLP